MMKDKAFTMKQLAQTLVDSISIREESYDQDGASEASKKADKEYEKRKKKENSTFTVFYPFVNYESFYTKTEVQAIEEAVKKNGLPKEIEQFISLALYWSNDVVGWAESIGVHFPKKKK
uniref:Uncharacterized protein n=1 Tax=viral metagenome TaxID=1070528 RepID=A0A6M3L9S4_9ZZZZ